MLLKIEQEVRPISWKAVLLEVFDGKEKPWSMPMMVGVLAASSLQSHSARPRRAQYSRGLDGG
jgi:hypothetical protein